jgi:S1-C subfamily serine protease
VGGRPVDSREAFSTYTATIPSGQPVQVSFIREGSARTANLRPVDPPRDLGLRILWEVAGLRVRQSGGVVIDEVASGSRSEKIGLAPGDTIVGVNGNAVDSIDQLNEELKKSAERSSIVLDVARGRYVYSLTFPMVV